MSPRWGSGGVGLGSHATQPAAHAAGSMMSPDGAPEHGGDATELRPRHRTSQPRTGRYRTARRVNAGNGEHVITSVFFEPGRATPARAGADAVSPRWGSEVRWDDGHASQPAAHAAGSMMSPRWGSEEVGLGGHALATRGSRRGLYDVAPMGLRMGVGRRSRRATRGSRRGLYDVAPVGLRRRLGQRSRLATRGSRRGLYDVAPAGLRGTVGRRLSRLATRGSRRGLYDVSG